MSHPRIHQDHPFHHLHYQHRIRHHQNLVPHNFHKVDTEVGTGVDMGASMGKNKEVDMGEDKAGALDVLVLADLAVTHTDT